MSLDHWFRLSGYLTLALSCGALVFAEAPFLPDLQICLPPVLMLLLLAWWVEGRWRLPNWGANILGGVIGAGGIAWLATQLADNESLLTRIPMHLALLPYMGPLLMAALLVKLFGARDASEFWRLQGLGLMQIGLGCVLDGGPVFGGLMVAYFAAALACLALRYRLSVDRRDAGPARASSAGLALQYNEARVRGRDAGPARALWLIAFTLRWTLLIAVPALLLFLFTPRRDNVAWEPLNGLGSPNHGQLQSGSEEINLNNTGRIELDDAIALQVAAVDADGQPKLDLPLDQRWRGVVLDLYENGKWRMMHPMPRMNSRRGRQSELPHFGAQQYILTFTVPPRQPGSFVLAEPIRFGPPSARLPVVVLSGERPPRLFYEFVGSVLPLSVNPRRELRYQQVVPLSDDSSRSSTEGVPSNPYLGNLVALPTPLRPQLQDWTVDLLRRLSRDSRYHLPEGVRAALAKSTTSFLIDPDDSESVARVLTEYLAASSEFKYSLYLTRQDRSIDPVLDFLMNVKQGHCERYATALALMLRSVGIQARVVKGFHGCDSLGEGQYVVRHRHAHAWVEMLVPRRPSDAAAVMPGREKVYDWLELDPTPAESAATNLHFSFTYLWEEIQRMGGQGWQTLIVDYNADAQAGLWDMLQSSHPLSMLLKIGVATPIVIALFCLGLFLRRLPRSRRTSEVQLSDHTAFYQRLMHLLNRYASLRPSCGQTPREYGEAARTLLQTHQTLAALAEFPIRVVDLFYRVRFGGQSLSDDERQALDAELDRFDEALRQTAVS